jgi:hypothetical protein
MGLGMLATGGTTFHKCDISKEKTFHATIVGGCENPGNIEYKWYYSTNGASWSLATDGDTDHSALVFDIADHTSAQTYYVRCDIRAHCTPLIGQPCSKSGDGEGSTTLMITYINPPTQCP